MDDPTYHARLRIPLRRQYQRDPGHVRPVLIALGLSLLVALVAIGWTMPWV